MKTNATEIAVRYKITVSKALFRNLILGHAVSNVEGGFACKNTTLIVTFNK